MNPLNDAADIAAALGRLGFAVTALSLFANIVETPATLGISGESRRITSTMKLEA